MNLTNPVGMVYNGYTIETNAEMSYEPDELTDWQNFVRGWKAFWNSPYGKGLAIGIWITATLIAVFCPPFRLFYWGAVVGIGISLGVGAGIAGFRSLSQGNGYWEGFANYIKDNWAQDVSISFALAMVTFGVSQAAQAIKTAGANKKLANSTTVCDPKCFIAGTLVVCRNENGEECRKPIEEIEVGDMVLAYDEETGKQAYKEVVRLFRNETMKWCTVSVAVNGTVSEITSIPGHKYYLPDNTINREVGDSQEHESYYELSEKWVSACKLKKGDKVLLSDGEYGIITNVKIEKLSAPETTYNFEVEDCHTYYVGSGVCVHNRNCGTPDLYRGGNDMTLKQGEYRLNADGLVKPTHGLSVNADPNAVAKFGGAYKVQSIPEGLKVIQRGQNLMHFEIVPEYAMSLENYQALLYQVQLVLT